MGGGGIYRKSPTGFEEVRRSGSGSCIAKIIANFKVLPTAAQR
jgi:hypothetical protein